MGRFKSGLYYPNKFGLIIINPKGCEQNSLNAILNLAALSITLRTTAR
jgi:hypothetical protein